MTAKALFVTSFGGLTAIASAVAGWQLSQGHAPLAWSGTLLAAAPYNVFLAALFINKRISRTRAHLPGLTVPAGLGVVLSLLPTLGVGGPASAAALGWTLASAAGVVLYVYWYSVFGRPPSEALRVGATLPAFALENAAGETVESADFRGAPAVLLFYRGNWCPLCVAQIRELAALYRELDARGVSVKLISAQPHGHTQQLAARFDVPFDFLVDVDRRAARRLGILSPDGVPFGLQALGYPTETVMPTVVITDEQGRVLFRDETDNYRVRPEPETFLRILDAHAAG